MVLRFCSKCNTMVYWDREGHYCCECIAILPVPDEDWPGGGHHPEFIPDHWIDTESDTVGVELIAGERKRQTEAEGWDWEHDDKHFDNVLAYAALCYLVPDAPSTVMEWWPWDLKWWKPKDNRIRQLKIAGALIAAEIDRLIRQEAKDAKGR